MKLTDQIKEKIDNAKSEEEVKTILENVKEGAEDAGLILDDEDLESYVYKAGAEYCEGIKGEWVEFETDKTYTNVACFASIKQRDAYGQYKSNSQFAFFGSGANLSWNWDKYINNMVAWTNYVSFCPVPQEA